MNSLKDLIITAVVVLGYFLLFGRKRKKATQSKKQVQRPNQRQNPRPIFEEFMPEEPAVEHPETIMSESANNAEIYPKNEEYFTYETVTDDEVNFAENSEKKSTKTESDEKQDVGTQKENNSLIDFDSDELVKGVIYSEILQRPYN